MHKLLFILGQTATGKTATALQFAKALHGDLISADSRQVYIGMDIGTGKDLPAEFTPLDSDILLRGTKLRAYTDNHTKIWLVDQVYPDEEWSVAHFSEAAWKIIPELWKENILPIIVGGTGFYLQSILSPAETTMIPRQEDLRDELDVLSLEELQERAKQLAPARYDKLNNSDLNNPRRLVRIIEVATTKQTELVTRTKHDVDALIIGLKADDALLEQRIRARVNERLSHGMVEEVKQLRAKYGDALPSFTATGYTEVARYLDKTITYDELVDQWTQRELDYAKRQATWFQKQLSIEWFNIRDEAEKIRMDKRVKSWYDT